MQSRLSPFANTRGMKEKTTIGEFSDLQASCSSDARKSSNIRNWFSFVDALMLSRKGALVPVKKLGNSLIANSKLHRTFYGFIVFEVAWSDVRGISYLNELQVATDHNVIFKYYASESITGHLSSKIFLSCFSSFFTSFQTDTSLAVEAKVMRRWEFDSTSQACRSIYSWFPGTLNEQILLKENLGATLGISPKLNKLITLH